jgi:hypothetical protein
MTFRLERVLLFAAACFSLYAFAGQSTAAAPLQAHLEPQQSEWVLGVPVELTASVTNVSSAPVKTYSDLGPEWDGIDFLISEDGSTFHGVRGPQWYQGDLEDIGVGTITLKPGAKVRESFSLLWNGPADIGRQSAADGFAFPHAGIYFVKARASSKLGDLVSNVVRVVIREPQGDDAAVWEVFKADKGLARFYSSPNVDPNRAEKLQELLSRYPNSSHAVFMKKALAVYARQKAEIETARKKGTPRNRNTSEEQFSTCRITRLPNYPMP